jgi:FG-GAP repeat
MRISVLFVAILLGGYSVNADANILLPTPIVVEDQKFVPSDRDHNDFFGTAIAVQGDTAMITAPGWDSGGFRIGSVYVYDQTGGIEPWTQIGQLTASDATPDMFFGTSIDIDGDLVVIGAPRDNTFAHSSGAAYVFKREQTGSWTQMAKLFANDPAQNNYFGGDVAISGNQIIVGAYGSSSAGHQAGAAYIFAREGLGQWNQAAKLIASNPTSAAGFGNAVDIKGNRAVVGAPHQGPAFNSPGAAYLYERLLDGAWIEKKILEANNPSDLAQFGVSVSIGDSAIAVGAPRTREGEARVGSVHLFELSEAGNWVHQRIDNPLRDFDDFGISVALAPNDLLVGADAQELVSDWKGAAHLFKLSSNGLWNLDRTMVGSGSVNGNFGNSVAMDRSAAFVGAWRVEFESGLAYFYDVGPIPEPSTLFLFIMALGCATSQRSPRMD